MSVVLNTGRLLQYWHTGSMPRRSYALDTIAPEAEVYVHPKDAADRGLAHGEMVRVRSRRGEIELRLKVSVLRGMAVRGFPPAGSGTWWRPSPAA